MDDLFAGMFDFNGDGVTDCGEIALGLSIFDEMFNEDDDSDEDCFSENSFKA